MGYYPEIPYKGNQIILCSDRLHLQSKKDSILIFGKQAVGISSINTVNIDSSKETIVHSPIIKLGSLNSSSPLVLGDKYITALSSFLDSLSLISKQISSVSAGEKPPNKELGNAMLKLATFAKQLSVECDNFKNQLSTTLSKTSFTQ